MRRQDGASSHSIVSLDRRDAALRAYCGVDSYQPTSFKSSDTSSLRRRSACGSWSGTGAKQRSPPLVRVFGDGTLTLSQLDQAIRRARLAGRGKLGLLRIGFVSTAGSEIVADIVRQFRELNPEVEFSLRNILTAEQIQMLETGALDIGFLRMPIGEHSALDAVTVHREPFVLVVPSSHKLAKRKRVRLREVAGENFVMYERTWAPGFHDLMFGILRDAGIVAQCHSDRRRGPNADLTRPFAHGYHHSARPRPSNIVSLR